MHEHRLIFKPFFSPAILVVRAIGLVGLSFWRNEMELATIGASQTMSSREIAALVGASHDNILKSIRHLVFKGLVFKNDTPYTNEQNGQIYTEFVLDFRNTMVVVSGYSAEMRAKIIDRWQELEAVQQPKLPATYIAALEALVLSEKARIEAVETKAQIGAKREATAMNTASQAVKAANRLQIELDKHKEYASIKRMELLYHGQTFKWRLLKDASVEIGVPPVDIFDANYGTVKAYHADAWAAAYAIAIDAGQNE